MKFMEKVWDNLGLFEPTERQEDQIKHTEPEPKIRKNRTFHHHNAEGTPTTPVAVNNVVSLPTASQNQTTLNSQAGKQLKVMVVEPCSFDDAQHVADYLKLKKAVVVNLENADDEVTRRMVDFISGTTYALNGTIQKVGNNIFLCAPHNVDITYNHREESQKKISDKSSDKTLDKTVFSWKGFN